MNATDIDLSMRAAKAYCYKSRAWQSKGNTEKAQNCRTSAIESAEALRGHLSEKDLTQFIEELHAILAGLDAMSEAEFLSWVSRVWKSFETPREPEEFELATARALWRAYQQTLNPTRETQGKFICVSAATGSGKTSAAIALACTARNAGKSVVFIIEQIYAICDVYIELCKVLPKDALAIRTSIHRADRRAKDVEDYRENAPENASEALLAHLDNPPHWTTKECENADILLITHKAFLNEQRELTTLGAEDRDVLIHDEEPALDRVMAFDSTGIKNLWHLIAESGERGNTAAALEQIHARACSIEQQFTSGKGAPKMVDVSLVEWDDVVFINTLEPGVVDGYIKASPKYRRLDREQLLETLDALKCAAKGRVFFGAWMRDFLAYDAAVEPHPRLIVLDATADILATAVGNTLHVVEGVPTPNYMTLTTIFVAPPDNMANKFVPGSLFKDRPAAERALAFLKDVIREHTQPGSKVLVHVKKDFRDGLSRDERHFDLDGRLVDIIHFGTGRGSNRWKDFDVDVRLTDFYPRREVLAAKMGAHGRQLDQKTLNKLSSGNCPDRQLQGLYDACLLIASKQDTARMRVRQLDGSGMPKHPCLSIRIEPSEVVVRTYADQWPGAPEPVWVGPPNGYEQPSARKTKKRKVDRAALLADILANPATVSPLSPKQLAEMLGCRRNDISRYVNEETVQGTGWHRQVTGGGQWELRRGASSPRRLAAPSTAVADSTRPAG